MGMVPIAVGPMSGVAAPADVFRAGESEWERLSGLSPANPLVGGAGEGGLPYDVDAGKSRIVTGTGAPDPASRQFDSWRDVMNWRHSPVFWVMLASLLVLGLIQLSLSAKAGPLAAGVRVGK